MRVGGLAVQTELSQLIGRVACLAIWHHTTWGTAVEIVVQRSGRISGISFGRLASEFFALPHTLFAWKFRIITLCKWQDRDIEMIN